jgi:carboxypeptidase Taq
MEADGPANGVLQDALPVGLFGYSFSDICLGNVYAGCPHEALRRCAGSTQL